MSAAFLALNPLPRFTSPSIFPRHASKVTVQRVFQPRMSFSLEPIQQLWRFWFSQMGSENNSTTYQASNNFAKENLPYHQASVLNIQPITAAQDLVQLTVDVSEARLNESYSSPGQFVRLALLGTKRSVLVAIASPPDPDSTQFSFILSPSAHGDLLKRMKKGGIISISDVMGTGLSVNLPRGTNLHVLVDSPQGFAAISALLEWAPFRASTGEGCNRTSQINVYAAIPTQNSMPYARKLSRWTAYGVSVFPVVSVDLVDFVANTVLGSQHTLANDQALVCVAEDETYNSLQRSLLLFGFRKSLIQKWIARDMSRYVYQPPHSTEPDPISEDMYKDFMRAQFERQVWQSWVGVREDMRRDFEQKWSTRRKMNIDEAASQKEKANDWASWSAKNRDQWKQVQWDNVSWKYYWKSWDEKRSQWQGESKWANGNQKAWNQSKSQEYWDWVGTGTGSGNKASGDSSTYSQSYSGSSWSRSNGWDENKGGSQRGYRYEQHDSKQKAGNRSSYWGNNAGSSWSGWNYDGSHRKSYSSSNRGYGSPRQGADIDFYNILGINSSASRGEIKKAYRQKAMEHHPDRNPGNVEEAHVKMKQIVVAWTVLRDDQKRQRYDRFGSGGI
ncbi:unnamed protein product [Agarophyton chilense]|eukprot:gb/GEZJ01001145.1/.p1 GENE.gb/GEZJ01001145.1/~~gb/GEZJ01001145.1/.p1  ORF type:complete len:669 (-),score=67.31 gb/GEZJ01001145.1/:3114-4961(-)